MNASVPEVVFPHEPEFGNDSIAKISVSGGGLTLWGTVETAGEPWRQVQLRLDPQTHVIVGRQEGGRIPYMDPNYRSTQIGPSGQSVLTSCGHGIDRCVSRGHFMLRGSPLGILFVNGVPRLGGGIRSPMNGTRLLEPVVRLFAEAEEYVVERGQGIKIRLPNGTEVTIAAG